MNVIVTGGRDYTNRKRVREALEEHMWASDLLVQGGATGADTLAKIEAMDMSNCVCTVHANWDKYGKSAGAIRNQEMLIEFGKNARCLIAFPGGRGTEHMTRMAKKEGLTIIVVPPTE